MSSPLTERDHWDDAWHSAPRMRLPLPVNSSVVNHMRLLRRHVKAGDAFLEIGCAPGKMLAWVAARLRARVTGVDYSPTGMQHARRLFDTLRIDVDLRCEDILNTSLPHEAFDVVYSSGVIEHFEDPRQLVQLQVQLVRRGGRAVIVVPHYGGVYGWLQGRADPSNLALHNLSIMSVAAMKTLLPPQPGLSVRSYAAGRITGTLVDWRRLLPKGWATPVRAMVAAAGLLQPFDIGYFSPMLVLEIRKH